MHKISKLAAFAAFMASSPHLAWAQNSAPNAPAFNQYPITQAQKLNDWLKANPTVMQQSYLLALGWITPEETQAQTQTQQALVRQLQEALREPDSNTFFKWLQNQPPSGRVPLSAISLEWLEAYPLRNPSLKPGDNITTLAATNQVTLLNGNGQGCKVNHQPGAYPADYLKACALTAAFASEQVWIIQPNGRTQALSLAPWSPEIQTQLAPQAIIWTGFTSSDVKGKVSSAQLFEINTATSKWLAKQTDGLASWTLRWPNTESNPIQLVAVPTYELTGISQARFNPEPSASNWGVVGLVQTPTARMRPAGSINFTFQRTLPYSNGTFMLQPLDWLEAGFRYTDISNRLYSSVKEFSGDQSYKDKSFELKAHLWPESTYLPSVAAGLRDLGGTGLFGGEYVVANKRWGRLDFSAGMGWGYVGGRQNLSNPLSAISQKFDVRQTEFGFGGKVSTKAFFRGPASVFGGVEYQTPWNMVLKAEYDGNNYQREPLNNNLLQKSAINLGMVYRVAPGIELSLSRERGTTWGIGFTFYSNWSQQNQYKLLDKPAPAVAAFRPKVEPNWDQTRQDIDQLTQWDVDAIKREGNRLILDVSDSSTPYHEPRVNKAMAVIHRDAPADIDQVELRLKALGDVLMVDRIDRQNWVQSKTEPARTDASSTKDSKDSKTSVIDTYYPTAKSLTASNQNILASKTPELFTLKPGMAFNHILGGPDGFLLYELAATLNSELRLPANVSVHGAVNLGLINNYDKFKFTGSSELPRVRTYQKEYVTASRFTMPTLYAAKAERLSTNWSALAYGGFLEREFAGVGGEVLYRQPGSRWAAGVDINKVRQRDFEQKFALRDYKVNTGHLSLYWQTPFQDINMNLSAGQYLAGDKGATLSLSKVFSNGMTMGAFATKTNVSAAQFGEGSFDKGVFWRIPFDALMVRSSKTTASFGWKPITRDGGAMLNRPVHLIGGTSLLDPITLTQKPANRPAEQLIPDDLGR
jgi:hypothetical protein